jgi:hypothetical protein
MAIYEHSTVIQRTITDAWAFMIDPAHALIRDTGILVGRQASFGSIDHQGSRVRYRARSKPFPTRSPISRESACM